MRGFLLVRQIDVLFSHLHNHPHHRNKYSHWERNSEFRERWNTRAADNYAQQIIKGQGRGRQCRVCGGVSVSALPQLTVTQKKCNIDAMKLAAITLRQQ